LQYLHHRNGEPEAAMDCQKQIQVQSYDNRQETIDQPNLELKM